MKNMDEGRNPWPFLKHGARNLRHFPESYSFTWGGNDAFAKYETHAYRITLVLPSLAY